MSVFGTSLNRRVAAIAGVCGLALAVSGCGVGTPDVSGSGALQIRGNIHGGQQPVSGATIKLYAAGKTGNASTATSMLVLPVTSDANGNFSLTGDYVCTNLEDQVYLTASGGNPGLSAGTNNAAMVMMDALGRCGDLLTTQFVTINEVTTVGAVYALAPFMNSAPNVGATATNAAGMKNAFANAKLLVSPYTGDLAVLNSNLTVETGKIYALANSIAGCVNSDGGGGCVPLFSAATPSGGNAPTNTVTALLNIVKNPANNVANVFYAASPTAPFPQVLTSAPSDWTLSMTVSGGGLRAPTAIGIDSVGNVWAAGYYGVVSAFSAQGVPTSASGYGSTVLSESYGLAIDTSDNVWVTVEEQPRHTPTRGSIAKYSGVPSGSPGILYGQYSDSTINYPVAASADTNGNMMMANYANASATIYNNTGGVVSGGLGTGNASFPVALAADASHGLWLANQGDLTVTHVSSTGAILARPQCCNGANGIAVDALGNAWVANYYGTSVSEVSAAGVATLSGIQTGGISYPSGVAIDGKQDVWVANYRGTSFTHLAGYGGTVAAGTALSPSAGFGQDASLLLPFGIVIDLSGNVWVSNFAKDTLVEFFGIATPTKTPVSPTPAIP